MNNLVIMENHQAVTTSLQVAETFGYEHKNVLQAIDRLKDGVAEKSADLFYDDSYVHPQNKQTYRQVIMNRDGFTLLAMGFNGSKALQFKLQYIDAFNKIEEQVKTKLPQTTDEKIDLLLESSSDKNKRLTKAEKRIDKLENDQPLAPGEYNYIGQQTGRAVSRYIKVHHLALTNQQRSKLFKDINSGVKEITGIKTRTQLRKKHFKTVDEFINNWTPSTATLTVIKQMAGEAEGQTELV